MVHRESSVRIFTYKDVGARGPSFDIQGNFEDTLRDTREVYVNPAGTIHGTIFDFTPASFFDVFRRESGAFEPLFDFALTPAKRSFSGHGDLFTFVDRTPKAPNDYLARGTVSDDQNFGILTNEALAGADPVVGDLDYDRPSGAQLPTNFRLQWAAYPGAAGYWVQVYTASRTADQAIVAAAAAPVDVGSSKDFFVGFFPAGVTSYTIRATPGVLPAGARVFTFRSLDWATVYFVRVAAVNAQGQLIGFTGESESFGILIGPQEPAAFPVAQVSLADDEYALYAVGSAAQSTRTFCACPPEPCHPPDVPSPTLPVCCTGAECLGSATTAPVISTDSKLRLYMGRPLPRRPR